MDEVSVDLLSTTNSLICTNIPETSDISKEKSNNILYNDEIDEDIQLRFSDDEEETSACFHNHQTNLQPKQNDLKFDARTVTAAEDISKSEQEKLTDGQNFYDANWGVSDREPIMSGSDRLGMYNGPKHWNFNKGWKGMNSSRGYAHRGGGSDWYKQPYSDKDKYSKTHYHNQSKFRLHNTPRSMFQSGPLDKNRVSKKDNVKIAQKLKHTVTNAAKTASEKKQLIKENGLLNGLRPESSVQKNKSIEDAKNSLNSIKIVNVTSEHKENISSVKSSSEQKRDTISDVIRSKRDKSGKNSAATVTKECEIVELDDDNSDSQESKSSYNGVVQRIIDDDDDADCIITEEMLPQKKLVTSEVINEMQIKIVNVGTSRDDTMEQENDETVMNVDDSSSQSECEIEEQCDEAGPSLAEKIDILQKLSNLDNIETCQEIEENMSEILQGLDANKKGEDEVEEKDDEEQDEEKEEKETEEIEQEEEAKMVEERDEDEKHEEKEEEKEEKEEKEKEEVNKEVENKEIEKEENIDEENEKVENEKKENEKVENEELETEESGKKDLENEVVENETLETDKVEDEEVESMEVDNSEVDHKDLENKEIEKVDEEKEVETAESQEDFPEKEDEEKEVVEKQVEEELEKEVVEKVFENEVSEEIVEESKKDEEKNENNEEKEEIEGESVVAETEDNVNSTNNDIDEKLEEEEKETVSSEDLQDNKFESTDNQENSEEKNEDTAVPAVDEVSEAMDAQSDIGSPKSLMIDETDGTESSDEKLDDKNDESSPPKSPDQASDDAEQSEQPVTSQVETDKESKIEEEKIEDDKKEDNKENDDKSNVDELTEKTSGVIEELDLMEDNAVMESPISKNNGAEKTKDDNADNASTSSNDTSSTVPVHEMEENGKTLDGNENERAVVHKKRRRKRDVLDISGFVHEENGVRLKRRSARNAEEMIRKEILKDDENDDDDDSSDEATTSSNKIAYNKKQTAVNTATALNLPRPLSPPKLKRTLNEQDRDDNGIANGDAKRLRSDDDVVVTGDKKIVAIKSKEENDKDLKKLVRDISQEDIKKKLKNLTSKEIEALLLQKIVECITIRGEMGKLREQARASKRTQEATRAKCQQLQKQVEGFEMVLKRITYDKTLNQDKYVQPIKINRSVGLQVNFQSDHGIQNLKQIQAYRATAGASVRTASTSAVTSAAYDNRSSSPKKIIKIRSPRKQDVSVVSVVGQNSGSSSGVSTAMTTLSGTTAQITSKLLEASNKRPITLQNAGNIMQILQPSQSQQQQQTIVVNRTLQKSAQQASANSSGTSDLIDLTDEEDKNKTPSAQSTTPISRVPARVFQAVTASGVPLTSAANLRLVTTNSQSSPTAIVNNLNGQKLAYGTVVVNGNKQLVLTGNQIRQVSSVQGKNIATIYNKQGLSTLAAGQTLRVLQPATALQTQVLRHPAPLPEITSVITSNPSWKLSPPAPSLKISKVATGIVLSWNMNLTEKFASIVSYQLFAYQEVAGTAPSPNLWKKVGDVRALPLPMACTLTQFTEGNNYHFAVRAVDEHSRLGLYSKPGNISL